MLIVSTLGAPPKRRWRRARPRSVNPEPEPEPLALTRVTVVTPNDLGEAADAARWLDRVAGEADAADTFVSAGVM